MRNKDLIAAGIFEALKETNSRLKLCQALLMYRYKNSPELGDTEYVTDETIRKNDELLSKYNDLFSNNMKQ